MPQFEKYPTNQLTAELSELKPTFRPGFMLGQKIAASLLCILTITSLAAASFKLAQHTPSNTSQSLLGQLPTQVKARDTERKTDIKALHAQIEAYWAQIGNYPSLNDLNSASFVTANLKGLDAQAFQDPNGTSKLLSASPNKNVYSYEVMPKSCDNIKIFCASYTLTATLEEPVGGMNTYVKKSLNE